MQGQLKVECRGCGKSLRQIEFDTAFSDWKERGEEIELALLTHRRNCPVYGKEEVDG